MKHVMIIMMLGLACHGAAVPSIATLTWSEELISYTATIEDEKSEATFAFINTGERPVTITSVKTSCGCTTAALDKITYEPGEAGEVAAIFIFGDRVGKQHKYITVTTSESVVGGDPVVAEKHLYMDVMIPEPVIIRPRMVYWKPGDDPGAKKVRVWVSHSEPVEIAIVEPVDDTLSAELKNIETGKQYELIIATKPHPIAPDAVLKLAEGDVKTEENNLGETQDGYSNVSDTPKPAVSSLWKELNLKASFEGGHQRIYKIRVRILPEHTEAAALRLPSQNSDAEHATETPIPSSTPMSPAIPMQDSQFPLAEPAEAVQPTSGGADAVPGTDTP